MCCWPSCLHIGNSLYHMAIPETHAFMKGIALVSGQASHVVMPKLQHLVQSLALSGG